MDKYTFVNNNGDSLTLSPFSRPIVLQGIDGLTENTSERITRTVIDRDGEISEGSLLQKKQITIKIAIVGSREEISDSKQKLQNIFNPRIGQGELTCCIDGKTSYITLEPDGFPDLKPGKKTGISDLLFVLIASYPYFTQEEKREDFSSEQGGISFDMVFEEDGICFGYRVIDTVKILKNPGTHESGMVIIFTASGAVVNPSFKCLESEEELKLDYTMSSGEIVTVNTLFDNHQITSLKNGVRTDITSYFNVLTDYIQIPEGNSTFVYDAESGRDNLSVSVSYNPEFIGV